ncbi:MAG: hypothetical protein L3J52_01170 [Proteobacteria bacterium]|nr:hypothetical protein [Pseudomonadota bacterium]
MKKIITMLGLTLCFLNTNAQTFEPPVIIDPPNPVVGDTIRVGLFTTFFPPCLILPQQNQQGDTHLFEFDNNHINFTVVALTTPLCNPFPVSPAPREFYELGQLPEGIYTMQVYGVDNITPLPVPITDPPTFFPYTFGGLVSFSVIQPKPIDSLSMLSVFLLIFSVLILTLLLSKRKQGATFWR